MTRASLSAVGAVIVLTLLSATCTGTDSPDVVNPTNDVQPTAATSPSVVRYTPEQLHANNPHDWVGQAHNLLVREMIRELRKPDVKVSHLCARMTAVVQDQDVLDRLHQRFKEADASVLKTAVENSPLCSSSFRWKKQFRLAATTTVSLSPAAEALVDDAVAQLEIASSPTHLASLLSPILSESNSMGDEDKEAVQATVSVSQSSMELWYDGSEYATVEDEVFDELDQCMLGNYENETYEVDEVTYICLDSEWRAVSLPGGRRQSLFRNASLSTAAPTTTVCGPSGAGIWVADGVGIAIGAKVGWTSGPGSIIVAAGVGASLWSGGFALYRAYYRYRHC